ncbi:MAG TPA: hypothetical protein VK458_25845 [Myxococcaceae bacterium]|nr:hypothetical protein [Myxococcaceae bacterium]
MSGEPGQKMARRGWLRSGLLLVAATTLGAGLWALPFPRSFYGAFPFPGWDWISTLGPYNEHLVRDYGAMNLALGVLLVSAAISPERRLSQVALLTYLAFAIPHFVFHAAQTHHFTFFHNALQLGSLGLLVLLPVALLVLTTLSVAHSRVRPAERPEHKGGITL